MSAILTNANTFLSHYLSYKPVATDFVQVAQVSITGTVTCNTPTVLLPAALVAPFAVGSKIFACVDSITDIATDMVITMKDGATTLGTATIEAHSGIDGIYPFTTTGSSYVITAPAASPTFTVTAGTAQVSIVIISILDSSWADLGQNFNEGVQFTKGVMATPVARGWNATDHSVRVRATNQFSIRQLYSSMLEGIAHLRGKTICIKDEVRPDGGSTVKETHFLTGVQFENCSLEVGGGGGNAGVDGVTGSGYFRRMYTWTQDATALAGTL